MTSVIAIPKAIRDVLGDEGSEALVEIFDKVSEGKKQNVLEFVGEKFERRLTEEVAKLNEKITVEVATLRVELKENSIAMIKWQVGMFITTVVLLLGLYATIIFK